MTATEARGESQKYFRDHHWLFREQDGVLLVAKTDETLKGNHREFILGQPKQLCLLPEAAQRLQQRFVNNGYQALKPLHITDDQRDTDFVSAGVQRLNSRVTDVHQHGFVHQPVVRTQYFFESQKNSLSAAAFINTGTISTKAAPDDYTRVLDDWISALSTIGVYAGDLTFRGATTIRNWQIGRFEAFRLHTYFRGLEIGDIGYLQALPTPQGQVNVVDAGFGLERVLHAINKTANMYDGVFPPRILLPASDNHIDNVRSATLIAAAGIVPGPSGPSYRLRQLISGFLHHHETETMSLIHYFYDQWSTVNEHRRTLDETTKVLMDESIQQRKAMRLQQLGIPKPKDYARLPLDTLAKKLYSRRISSSEVVNT